MKSSKAVIILLLMTAFFSCSTPNEIPEIGTHYKLDLKIENVGNHFKGIAVLVDKPLYTLELESAGSMDYLSFNSCSTTITSTDAGGIFNRKKTKVNFRPNEIEKELGCDARIDVINKKQSHTFGYVLFQNPLFKSKAFVVCGKNSEWFDGVAGCQLLAGNKLRIKFDQSALAFSSCDESIPTRSEKFDIIAQAGFCNYYFSSNKEKFRLLVYGWTEELLGE